MLRAIATNLNPQPSTLNRNMLRALTTNSACKVAIGDRAERGGRKAGSSGSRPREISADAAHAHRSAAPAALPPLPAAPPVSDSWRAARMTRPRRLAAEVSGMAADSGTSCLAIYPSSMCISPCANSQTGQMDRMHSRYRR